jgi:ubiquinone/menaquinone biosynthesis C-methylase UbiE
LSIRVFAAAVLLALAVPLLGQGKHPVSGRTIANVMGHQGASWLERAEREKEEAPSKAIAALQIKPGDVVADVGAGSGYYSVLGDRGRVYATDIQPEMLALIRTKMEAAKLTNVDLVLGAEADPRLPAGALDMVVMVDVYHELGQPQAMLQALKRTLKPEGRLVLIEFRKESEWVPIREEHKMTVREARMEVEAEGYRFDRVLDVLPWQHILIFRR